MMAMQQNARWAVWTIAVWLLASAAACSDKTEIAREPAQAGDQRGDASAGPATPVGGKTDGIGTGGDHGAANEPSDAGSAMSGNDAGRNGNAGAGGSGSAGTPGAAADAAVGSAGAGGGGGGGSAGTAVGGSGGMVGPSTRCLVSGCSNTICAEQVAGPMLTTCEFQAEYACYATATCERQSDGQCGWTQTADLIDCIDNARGM